ncbi:MAG: hypothetical protein J0L53_05770 [Spirochaetes bacterium]|nr:hypothetical protein [Spirochaetota bacterium]
MVSLAAPFPAMAQGTVQRKVLIFDFENQTGKIEFDYLSGSISDALSDAIKKTGKFRLMLREDARMNSVAEPNNVAPNALPPNPAEPNSANPSPKENSGNPNTVVIMNVKVARKEAIKRGREAGADVVVLGKFSELNGVLLMSAQAFEADTRQLKVSEEVLTKSDSDMFNGINILANKIAESMARELPMFDAAEAERRRALAEGIKAEVRDWEIQLFAGFPLLHPLYSSDGTITYSKGIPVQKLTGYSMGATFWDSMLVRKFSFMPRGARLGLQSKLTLLSGQADIVGANAVVLTQGASLSGVFVSNHLMFGVPYWQWERFIAFAEVGGGAVYTRLATTDSTIFSSWQPSAVLGTSGAYHFSYWSLGLSYRAQFTMFAQNQVFMQHDLWLYAGVRL